MESLESKTTEIKERNKTGKRLISVCIFFLFVVMSVMIGYRITRNSKTGGWPQTSSAPVINSIEISTDKKSIFNIETGETIFTINDAKKYLHDAGYEYNPDVFLSNTNQTANAKYAGDCFDSAVLSNNKDRIVFSTGCLPGDLPQAWIGIYDSGKITKQLLECSGFNNLTKTAFACIGEQNPIPSIYFLIGSNGKNFVWSADDKTITYESEFRLSFIGARSIDSQTGEIREIKNETKIDISDWLTYDSTADAETYHERYKIKYPRELFYKIKRDSNYHRVLAFFTNKQGNARFSIEVLPEMIDKLPYDPQNYFVSNIKISDNDFQELRDNKSGELRYIYKSGYSDKNHHGDFYIIFNIFDFSDREIFVSALGSFRFLGNVEKKEAIIGADEGSWKQVFKSEKYGFQLKAQNGFNIIDKLDDNLSMIFVSGFSNINLSLSRLSGVSTAEEWLDRELTINKYAAKKSEREYYRIGDSKAIGIMADQADSDGKPINRVFYAARGQYLYLIAAPLAGINEFAFARMVDNFRFLEPKFKLIGLRSKWVIDNVFEFDESAVKLVRILDEKDFSEKGYQWKDVKWYDVKIAGVVPDEIKSFFPITVIAHQGLLSLVDWKKYQSQDKKLEFMLPSNWEKEAYESKDTMYFNFTKSRTDNFFPQLTIMIEREPVPIETLFIVGDVQIVKFNDTESLLVSMYGKKGESDSYIYVNGAVHYFVEFHTGGRDYYIEADFEGGNYNKNIQTLLTILSSMKFNN